MSYSLVTILLGPDFTLVKRSSKSYLFNIELAIIGRNIRIIWHIKNGRYGAENLHFLVKLVFLIKTKKRKRKKLIRIFVFQSPLENILFGDKREIEFCIEVFCFCFRDIFCSLYKHGLFVCCFMHFFVSCCFLFAFILVSFVFSSSYVI